MLALVLLSLILLVSLAYFLSCIVHGLNNRNSINNLSNVIIFGPGVA